uniref:hypothetical protein n=1 Tax=Agathobacter sp. TaxID=2021311 RepID=UPI0040572F4F
MASIRYDIDKTEVVHFEGQTLQELELFLYPNKKFKDCCGSITYERQNRFSIEKLYKA